MKILLYTRTIARYVLQWVPDSLWWVRCV